MTARTGAAISVRELIDTKNRSFSPSLIKAFLEQISFYPSAV